MNKVNKSWMAVVAAALLLGTLVGVVWARPNDRPEGADTTRKVTLTGADFTVEYDAGNWTNLGGWLYCGSGTCSFVAPVVFPCLPSVTVERIRLHVKDDNATAVGYTRLMLAVPSRGRDTLVKSLTSPSGVSDGLKTYTSDAINRVVWPSQKAYIFVAINGPSIWVYGVTVEYHRNI